MAKYQAYAEYKDSGVEWLGEIPESWTIAKLGIAAFMQEGPGLRTWQFTDSGTRVICVTNITENGIDFSKLEKFISNAEYFQNYQHFTVNKGDILLSSSGNSWGKIATYFDTEKVILNTSTIRLNESSNKKIIRDFIKYILSSLSTKEQLGLMMTGACQPNFGPTHLGQVKVTIPSKNEQTQIANFLDHETRKIDHLIEKQQQLIELLKEKRQAVISHAVTKGLNPNVKMKDSGVEWLGEVPEHWEVSKFGYISQVVRGGSPRPAGDPTLFNGDYSPWVTVAEITKDDELYLTSTETFLTKKGSEQCRVFKAGTLLLSNSGATLGVPKILCIDANANDGVVGFEQLQIDIEFAYYYLSILTNDLRERVKQGSGQPNLNTDIVKNISIAIPPLSEIQLIVTEIKGQVEKFVSLIQKAERQILLMQERRTALISAAVTGKIDVRNWQAPTVAEADMEFSA